MNLINGSVWRKWDLQGCTRMYTGYKGSTLSKEQIGKLNVLTGISKERINSEHKDLTDEEYASLYIEYLVNYSDINVVVIAKHNTAVGTQAILDYLESMQDSEGRYAELVVMPGVEIGCSDR